MRRHAAELNPKAALIETDLVVTTESHVPLAGKRVIVVEDGPTLTHGGIAYGAGTVAARVAGAHIIDPRSFAVGTVAEAYANYPHIGPVLPALGYSDALRAELKQTIGHSGAKAVVDASPARLDRVLQLRIPVVRVRCRFEQRSGPSIFALVEKMIAESKKPKRD